MGNQLSAAIGYFIIFIINIKDRLDSYISKPNDKNFYSNDIILKDDDEHKAGKNLTFVII